MQGKVINGFELKNRLGMGGMAEVWYAENKIGKKAAVKFLLEKYCGDSSITSRFYTEAKIMVELNHPNIRQVYDYGEIDGRPVIVMEYLEGEDLKERLKKGQHFTEEELKKWWNQLVSALNYTHKKGIIHRDIKPGNIFVDEQGDIKLLDFGIAKVKESISSTQTGQKIGTLMYMSPEQVRDSKHIDYHTDIYSLAVTYVHIISGKSPYDADTTSDFEISEQIVYKPIDLSLVPAEWRRILSPYLEKDPNARPALKPFDMEAPARPRVNNPDDEATFVDGSDDNYKPQEQKKPQSAPDADTVEKKGSSKKTSIIIILAALMVCIGIAAAWMINNNQKRAKIIDKMIVDYHNYCNQSDLFLQGMLKDKYGHEADRGLIIKALESLQGIEKIEKGKFFNDIKKDPRFTEWNLSPCYDMKFKIFRLNLATDENIVQNKYQWYVDNEFDTEDNDNFVEIRDRLFLIQNLIEQSKQGSALAIKLGPKNENNN